MKILINRRPIIGPWGGGNHFVRALCDTFINAGHEVVHHFCDNIDVIFMQDPRYDEIKISVNEIIHYKKQNPKTVVVHRVNECDARKNTNDVDVLLRECSKYTDHTVFVSEWMQKYHLGLGWNSPNYSWIYNGVDYNIFKPNNKFNNGKINVVTHHWSDNYLKGFDAYEFIDDLCAEHPNLTFTYIGRERGTFNNARIIDPLYGEQLGAELGKYDVYISGSKFDPGPNHILESLACKIPTYVHINGGGAVEFAGASHSYSSLEELKALLLSNAFIENKFIPVSWEKCMMSYLDLLNALVK